MVLSREPKTAEYKEILHPAESRMLGSLFREDIKVRAENVVVVVVVNRVGVHRAREFAVILLYPS